MTTRIRKAILPVAGLGTRFLPATKATPKELLPVVDKPVIHYAIEEARAAGIEKFIFVTSRGKSVIEDHFDAAPELERLLEERGKTAELKILRDSTLPSGSAFFVRQSQPLGLGHAVLCAREFIGEEPFAVLLPDDIVMGTRSCMAQLVEAHGRLGGGMVIATQNVPRAETRRYGVIDPEPGQPSEADLVRARGLVEKPSPESAPSTMAVIGRYVLEPSVFGHLERGRRGAGGEIQLTDAIAAAMAQTPVYGLRFEGLRYDCGDRLGFLKANVAFGLKRPDLAPGLRAFLRAALEESEE